MNRATPKTREWAMNSMQAFIGYEEYSLNVLKKIIAKKVIELCLNNTELTKKNIPEIFCWDFFHNSLSKQFKRNVLEQYIFTELLIKQIYTFKNTTYQMLI